MKKTKVVWLCHLTNEHLDNHFNKEMNMCAYWMTQFIDIIKYENIELHIVSPNYYNNRNADLSIDGVNYHLYKYYSGIGGTKSAIVECTIFSQILQNKVQRIISLIKPDIIHLFGAENITYSQGFLPFIKQNNTILTFQGYIQQAKCSGNFFRRLTISKRVKIEDTILKEVKNITFGDIEEKCREFYMKKYGKGVCHILNFPIKLPNIDASSIKKEYDIVFWGRVTVDKGVEDLINAVYLLKKKRPNISCLILGGGSEEYRSKLDALVYEKGLESNIHFGGFQKTNEELFSNASKARVYVLPTHYDALPGSIRESMYMKLPVVSYPVGDIPQLNKGNECVLLAKYLDIEDLASKISQLLDDEIMRNRLIANSYSLVSRMNDTSIAKQFMDIYRCLLTGDRQ